MTVDDVVVVVDSSPGGLGAALRLERTAERRVDRRQVVYTDR